jgi:glycosyltransferase involved in cell wall biosynthesis
MQSSSHVARWIRLIADQGWDLHVFPVNGVEPNFDLAGVTIHWPLGRLDDALLPAGTEHPATDDTRFPEHRAAARLVSYGRIAAANPAHTLRRLRDRIASGVPSISMPDAVRRQLRLRFNYVRPAASFGPATAPRRPDLLATAIRELQPDLIHSMEFQHAGYLVLAARAQYGAGFPKWLATNWGSDIFYFGRFADHNAQIRKILGAIDFYSCECQRDVAIAQDYGYAGETLPVLPNSAGFDLDAIARLRSPLQPSRRRLVMVKGYEHFAGRALTALKVLERFADALKGYRIVLYSATPEPRRRALELRRAGTLDIEVLGWAPHARILTHFAQARIYLGISISDGISTSLLEAMAMGAFPIQTDTSCCNEWFVDGLGGFAVPPDDFDLICDRFRQALQDDALVDRARVVNEETVRTRLDNVKIKRTVVAMYQGLVKASKPRSEQ